MYSHIAVKLSYLSAYYFFFCPKCYISVHASRTSARIIIFFLLLLLLRSLF